MALHYHVLATRLGSLFQAGDIVTPGQLGGDDNIARLVDAGSVMPVEVDEGMQAECLRIEASAHPRLKGLNIDALAAIAVELGDHGVPRNRADLIRAIQNDPRSGYGQVNETNGGFRREGIATSK